VNVVVADDVADIDPDTPVDARVIGSAALRWPRLNYE
jgi:hypothetical protein